MLFIPHRAARIRLSEEEALRVILNFIPHFHILQGLRFVLGGGAIPDILNGQTPSDFDFYYYSDNRDLFRQIIVTFAKSLKFGNFMYEHNEVITLRTYNNINLQFTLYPSYEVHMENIDIKCTQTIIKDMDFIYTPLSKYSLKCGVIEFDDNESSQIYFERLKKYFNKGYSILTDSTSTDIAHKYSTSRIRFLTSTIVGHKAFCTHLDLSAPTQLAGYGAVPFYTPSTIPPNARILLDDTNQLRD